MNLFHILRLLSNNNLHFAMVCIFHILTQDSSLHACAKLHLCTLAYVKDMNQLSVILNEGAQWLSGRVLDSRPKGSGFGPHRRHCVVVLEQDTFILA